MKISRTYPPNIDAIRAALDPLPNAVFTYGHTIHAPSITDEKEIEPHLMIHEQTHEWQQTENNTTPEEWWTKYLADPAFRLAQELQAYAGQYKVISQMSLLSSKQKNAFLDKIASDLSGPMYGNILSFAEAKSKIRNGAKDIKTV